MSKGIANKKTLEGKFFHAFKEDKVEWQGCVVSEPKEGFFLVQLFEWVTGARSCQKLVRIEDMIGWKFYDTDKEMNDAYQRTAPDRS